MGGNTNSQKGKEMTVSYIVSKRRRESQRQTPSSREKEEKKGGRVEVESKLR